MARGLNSWPILWPRAATQLKQYVHNLSTLSACVSACLVFWCLWIKVPPGRRLKTSSSSVIMSPILPPSAPLLPQDLFHLRPSPAQFEWVASHQQKTSSPHPPQRRQRDRWGDRRVSAHPFNPGWTERLFSEEVGNPLIRGLTCKLYNRPVALFGVVAARWDTNLCLCIVEHTCSIMHICILIHQHCQHVTTYLHICTQIQIYIDISWWYGYNHYKNMIQNLFSNINMFQYN